MKKVLIISDTCTHPTRMGNSFAILAQVECLKRIGCEVHILYFQERQRGIDPKKYDDTLALMREYWGNNLHYFIISSLERFWHNNVNRIRDKFYNGCHTLYDLYPWHLTRIAKSLQNQYDFDACIVNYIFFTKVFDKVDFPIKACFTHDTFAYKILHVNELCKWVDANSEAESLQRCTDVLAIQEEEMNYFKVLSPRSKHYSVFTPYEYNPQLQVSNHKIVFLSGANIYNQNGFNWFMEEVFPKLRKKVNDAEIVIGGGICNSIRDKYSGIDGVNIVGFVENPTSFYQQGDVSINPTYQGTGLKIKTFEAIANDKVTIVHPHSTSGIFDKEHAPLFVSANPDQWVEYISSVWENPHIITRIKAANKEYIKRLNDHIESEYKRLLFGSV